MRTGLIVGAVVVVAAVIWFVFAGGEPAGEAPVEAETETPEATVSQ